MGHRTEPHTPGYQKCIPRGSVQPGGWGKDWSVLLLTLSVGPHPHPLQTYLNGAALCVPAQLPDVHKGVLSCRE